MAFNRSLHLHLAQTDVRSLTLTKENLRLIPLRGGYRPEWFIHWSFHRVRNNFEYLRNYRTDGKGENTKLRVIATRSKRVLLVYIINLEKYPAAAVGVTPKIVYCGAVDWLRRVKFSGNVGPVIQQVVLTFGVAAANGALTARAHVRHRVNMGYAKFGNSAKSGRYRSDPGRKTLERVVVERWGQHQSIEDRWA